MTHIDIKVYHVYCGKITNLPEIASLVRRYCIPAVNIFDRKVKRLQRERAAKRFGLIW